jgi:lipid-A-disaccharide synthase
LRLCGTAEAVPFPKRLKPETRNSKLSFLISAGEASGEAYGAQLISALRSLAPDADFFGLGSDRMRAAGCDTVIDAREVSVVGLAEVVSHLPKIYGEFRKLLREVDMRRPSAAILIDFPDFNFRLARKLHARGIPVFYYVSPQLWAWRKGRINLVRKYVRKMLVIFPFEEQFYREHGVEVEYVGHPLADAPPAASCRDNFASENGLDTDKPWIALLPGSRRKEVEMNLPEMLRASKILGDAYEYVLPVAPTLDASWLKNLVESIPIAQKPAIHFAQDARAALVHARAGIVASGTATVEAALIGTPFVVVYRLSGLTWTLGRRLVNVPHFAMVNLIAGREVVPEIIQKDFTGENVVAQVRRIVGDGSARETMVRELAEVRCKLHPSDNAATAARRASELILRDLQ